MNFEWTQHRFSGGVLAFDAANTVVLRHDPDKRIDRIATPADLAGFALAASRFCHETEPGASFLPCPTTAFTDFVEMRERIDTHFRAIAVSGKSGLETLAPLISQAGLVLEKEDVEPLRLDAAMALSAMRLAMEISASPALAARVKLCANCGWLLLDKSRNRSRTWCDMAVCGNREKAKRHYYRSQRGANT
ncbi:MAG: CGNR zinc finger domain-containing protein [Nitratireductor sp.]